ncbi:PD40 domain-containing protein, partial [candidate division KSB1 bacterium]|nr:PD40 domain-containing protein [candidate division KSB1 bacterium]
MIRGILWLLAIVVLLQVACSETNIIDAERILPAEVTLVSDGWDNLQPAWLPDGSGVVYVARPKSAPSALGRERGLFIRRVDRDARTIRELVADSTGVAYPAVSPDGLSLVFCAGDAIRIFDLHDQSMRQVSDEDGDELLPRWSPDGETLAYLWRGRLRLRSAVGGPAATFEAPDSIRAFCWLPDGSGWLYSARRNGTVALFQLQRNNGQVMRVPSNEVIGDWPAAGAPPPAVHSVIGLQILFHYGTS